MTIPSDGGPADVHVTVVAAVADLHRVARHFRVALAESAMAADAPHHTRTYAAARDAALAAHPTEAP